MIYFVRTLIWQIILSSEPVPAVGFSQREIQLEDINRKKEDHKVNSVHRGDWCAIGGGGFP